jgi:2-polyprenyl-3-methyl-5-hydroxy-6-metoxy-1,4-benzoquinol methylase
MNNPGTSNHEKYTVGAQNPVVRRLMDRLFGRVRGVLEPLRAGHLLDAGCGEGHALNALADVLPKNITGFDLNPAAVDHCRGLVPHGQFTVENIYHLPYADGAFDAVLCMEVLEHLDQPGDALAELARVCSGHLILSVPFEPWFRLGNLARGKHLAGWGNHPEHVQWWDLATFPKFLAGHPGLAEIRVREAWPWIVASARVIR